MFVDGRLDEALTQLGELLAERGQAFDVVAIGGGGLQLLGLIARPTEDLDLIALRDGDVLISVADGLPPELRAAVSDIARILELDETWMNGGPSSVTQLGLPEGFLGRAERRRYRTLGLTLASRFDQIHLKLYAAADDVPNGKHHRDLERLKPTFDELQQAAAWTRSHDPSEGFAIMLAGVFAAFGWPFVP